MKAKLKKRSVIKTVTNSSIYKKVRNPQLICGERWGPTTHRGAGWYYNRKNYLRNWKEYRKTQWRFKINL